jgi:hypothetical protein
VRWLSAKLLLYDGKVENAAEVLARLSKDFPVTREKDETQANSKPADDLFANDSEETPARLQVLGEVGVLRLARREYTEALDALLRSGFWMDASYVAERVLTLPELTAYVDAQWPLPAEEPVIAPEQEELEHPDAVEGWGREIDPNVIRGRIRYLLGRRLVRSHEEVKALAYLPEEWRVRLKEYLALAEAGRDPEQPARERARKLFEAAKLMREHGLELWGTEAAPDWFVYSGSFTEGVTVEAREAIAPENHLVAHPEEIARAKAHQPEPDKRFHYRYTAAQLGLEAAKLLPDNDDETALVLCTAGSWLKYCDPKAADPYYKTLVRRCRKTVIGKEADRIRWFPRIDENGKILPRPAPAPAAPVAVPPEALEQFPLAMR